MTSISQPSISPSQGSNKAAGAAETSSTLAPTFARSSYAHATKKSSHAQTETTNEPMAVGSSATNQQVGSDSLSPVNGKPAVTPAVPTVGAPTIVNGNNVPNPTSPSDHTRKPSFTVSAAGATGYPNGGSTGAPPSRTNSIQFGSMNAGGSPAHGNPAHLANQASSTLGVNSINPRVSSPQTSPSPIPQPAASGGRPPSSLQPQGNGLSFGSLGGDSGNPNQQMRSLPQGPLASGPQPAHLRRESSQSAHGEMGNPAMNGPGRGGYPQQAGRGRGSFPPYQQQMSYSPQQSFRAPPGQPRGGMSMAGPYHPQGRPIPGYPGSPNPAARSPALTNSHPATPNMGQIPMNNPQMQSQHYSGYSQQMGPPHGYMQPGSFDPNMGYYQQQFMHPQQLQPIQPYMPPSSPRPSYMAAGGPSAPYMQQQYSNQPQPQSQAPVLSRSSSQISASDRPSSSLGGQQTPAMTNVSGHSHTASRATSSPAPKPQFTVPPKKSAGIVIKDPNSGAIKTFDKTQPASPARATPSPGKVTAVPSTATPPPRSTSQPADAPTARSESVSVVKTDEEKKKAMQEAVARKVAADEAEAKSRKEAAAVAEAKQMKEEAERKLFKEQEETKAKEVEAQAREDALKAKEEADAREAAEAKEKADAKDAADAKAKFEAEEAAQEAAKAARDAADESAKSSASAEKNEAKPDEDDFEAQIAEMERLAAEEEERELKAEAEYQKKKQAQKEEQARKDAEEAAAYEENMKQAEREAEAREEERLKRQEALEGDESQKIFATLKNKDAPTPESNDSPAVRTPDDSGIQTPSSDISMGPPAKAVSGGKPKPAALKLETNKQVEPPQPSAAMKSLHSARFLEDPRNTTYPPSIVSPSISVNPAAPSERKFKYNKEFLLQFQSIFKEKPSIDWDAKVRDTVGDGDSSARPQSARTPSMMGGRNPSNRPGIPQNFSMGSFGAPPRPQQLPPGTTSAERFAMSNAPVAGGQRGPPAANPFQQFGRPAGLPIGGSQMSRTNSSNPMSSAVPPSPRVGGSSHRGSARSGSKRDNKGHGKNNGEQDKSMPLTAGLDLKPIQHSATGWVPQSLRNSQKGPALGGEGLMAPDVVQRKVKALLNKMTPDNFERIATQIIEIANQSKHEDDGRTLRQVIQLLFEKATDEPPWASMYAQLAQRMLESMSAEIKDEGIRDKAGNVVTGGGLFRKYLLNRCQEDFERGWKTQLPALPEAGDSKEATLLSDEYYVAAAAKRRGLGLVKFIGELYKLSMLTERIMHECLKKLLDYEGVPDEAEIESLTSLLRTIGGNLDQSEKGAMSMTAYFDRIQKTIDIPDLPSRLKFMLMDIVDLRKHHWHSKDDNKGPKTIQAIRDDAARAQMEADQERARTQRAGGGRMPMGRGDARNFSGGYNQMPPPDYTSSKVASDDLRRLGKGAGRNVSNTGNSGSILGPSSLFAGRTNSGRKALGPGGAFGRGGEDSGASSRTATPPAQKEREKKEKEEAAKSNNAFSALESLESEHSIATSPPSAASSPPAAKSRPAVERQRSTSPSRQKEGEGSAEAS